MTVRRVLRGADRSRVSIERCAKGGESEQHRRAQENMHERNCAKGGSGVIS